MSLLGRLVCRFAAATRVWPERMPSRISPADDDGSLREHLLSEAERFREMYGRMDPAFWRELSKPVDVLAAGQAYRSFRKQAGVTPRMYAKQAEGDLLAQEQAYRLHRWELPEDHPERWVGDLNDLLVLTADDKLLPCD